MNIFNWLLIILGILILSVIIFKISNTPIPIIPDDNIQKIIMKLSKNKYTILDTIKYVSKKYPNKPALKINNKTNWKIVNYCDYYKNVINFAQSINYWLGPKVKTAIFGFNSPGWYYAYLGCMMNNGISIGIHHTYNTEMCKYIINNSKAELIVIDNDEQLEKLIGLDIPTIKLIVYYSPIKNTKLIKKFKIPVLSMGNFMSKQNEFKIKMPKIDDIATYIYTNGVTKNPKQVIIKHSQIITSLMGVMNFINEKLSHKISNEEQYLSYLPLNNMLTQILDIYVPICTAGTVWFADKKNASDLSIEKIIKIVKPTIFNGVSEVWEKIYTEIKNMDIITHIKKIITPRTILSNVGLDKCKIAIIANSQLSNDIMIYFKNDLKINLYDFNNFI